MAKDESAPALYTLTAEQLTDLLKAARPTTAEQLELIKAQALANAEANRQSLRPENPEHPGISVFSRPGGEKINPKGALRCRTSWAGTPVDMETISAVEFDLINQLQPGEYRCTRQDGTKFPVTITATTNPSTGELDKLDIFFATRGQLHHGLPSLVQMCEEMLASRAKKTSAA